MNEIEEISVIIPTYNRAHSIVKSVESVIHQTYPVSEIIIADDCSVDDTKEVVDQIEDARIHYYRLPENRGAGGARNYGVARARCEIIAFHDSDDEWVPEKIEKQMKYMENHPEFGLVYSAYVMNRNYGIRHIVPDMGSEQKLEGHILGDLLFRNTVDTPTVIMQKKIFEAIGGFDESMRSLEDWDLAIRVARQYPIGFVPEILVEEKYSAGGVSAAQGDYYKSRCYMLRKYRAEYLQTGMFDVTVKNILELAKEDGILELVEKMLTLYMAN